MSGQNGGNNDWDAFDWTNWGQEPAADGHGHDRGIHGDLARLSPLDDGRHTSIDQTGEEGEKDEGASSGAGGGKWVSQGGILHWEGTDDEQEAPGGIRAEAESRSISSSVPGGAASRRSRSKLSATGPGSWPGASRIETFASAKTGSTVLCRCGDPPSIPLTSTDGSLHVRR